MKPLCIRCGKRPAYGKSAICRACHIALEEAGLKWCNGCRQAIAVATYGASVVCTTCKAARRRGAATKACLRCGTPAPRRSALCQACHDALKAAGLAWCRLGEHAVDAAAIRKVGVCRDCDNARARAAGAAPTHCATCGARVATHAKCDGCKRLLHGMNAALCALCARDRAAGVPPQGYSWREEAAA